MVDGKKKGDENATKILGCGTKSVYQRKSQRFSKPNTHAFLVWLRVPCILNMSPNFSPLPFSTVYRMPATSRRLQWKEEKNRSSNEMKWQSPGTDFNEHFPIAFSSPLCMSRASLLFSGLHALDTHSFWPERF